MRELKRRWKSETPVFFKQVIRVGITLGVVGATIISAPVVLPVGVVSVGTYMVTIGGTAAALAKLTKI
jgi:hypothetical protein